VSAGDPAVYDHLRSTDGDAALVGLALVGIFGPAAVGSGRL